MDKRTKIALINSIIKWEHIAFGYGSDKRSSNCALCRLFLYPLEKINNGEIDCELCPVFMDTGHTDCSKTPYEDWHVYFLYKQGNLYWFSRPHLKARTEIEIQLAKKEWMYLQSLLEEEYV